MQRFLCVVGLIAGGALAGQAQSVQLVNHIAADRRLPAAIETPAAGATDAAGKPLPAQRVGRWLYVGAPAKGLATCPIVLESRGQPNAASAFEVSRNESAALRARTAGISWVFGNDGRVQVGTAGRAFDLTLAGGNAAWELTASGPLVLEVARTVKSGRQSVRVFDGTPYFEMTFPRAGTEAPLLLRGPAANNGILRLLSSHKCSTWGLDAYMDDLDTRGYEFDFFFPFDWAALEGAKGGLAILPTITGYRLNLKRADTNTWELRAGTLADFKDGKYDSRHQQHGHAAAPEQRLDGLPMAADVTVGLALLGTNTAREAQAWQLQSLPAVILQPAAGGYAGSLDFAGIRTTVRVEDRNKNGVADVQGDRWTWMANGVTNMIYEYTGAAKQMDKTLVYAGLPLHRGLLAPKEADVPRVSLVSRRKDGTVCDGSMFFGGVMSDGQLFYDVQLNGKFGKDAILNYEMTSFDLDGDGILDVLYMPEVNTQGNREVPEFFGGEASAQMNLAHRPILFGVALDPFTGYCQPLFNARYMSAGDTLTHFWSLNRTMPGWWQSIQGCLLGGHDWPQAVMDLSNDGFADVRFYTEGFAVKRNPAKDWTFDNVEFLCNPMRWTINLDANKDLTTSPQAHNDTSDRARDWDICLYNRRGQSHDDFMRRLKNGGIKEALFAGYSAFTNLYPSIIKDPWGNSLGVTGPNQPPPGWKGGRVSYFDPQTGRRTGWGTGLDWLRTMTFETTIAVYTDYDCANKHANEATHPGVGNMNRIDVDSFGRASRLHFQVYFSPVTGRMHLRGANFGYDMTSETSYEDPVNPLKAEKFDFPLPYQYWVYAINPETFVKGNFWTAPNSVNRRFTRGNWYDMDGDGYFDTYLFQHSNALEAVTTAAFYLQPREPVQPDRPTAFAVEAAAADWMAVWTTNLDFRSRSLLPDNMTEYQRLNALMRETQDKVIANNNTLRMAGVVEVSENDGLPAAAGCTPAFFLKNARPKVALDARHGGPLGRWTSRDANGFAAVYAAFSAQGAQCVDFDQTFSGEALAGVDVLMVGALAGEPISPAETKALLAWIDAGGRLLICLPPHGEEMSRYVQLLQTLGIRTGDEFGTVTSLETKQTMFRMRKDLNFNPDPKQPSDLRDVSGMKLFFSPYAPGDGIDQLNLRSGRLLQGGTPLLTFKDQPFVTVSKRGRGLVMTAGTADLFNNMCVSTCMNGPRTMLASVEACWSPYSGASASAFWNRFTGGIVVRDNLIRAFLSGRGWAIRPQGPALQISVGRPAELWAPNSSPVKVAAPGGDAKPGFRVYKLVPGSYQVMP